MYFLALPLVFRTVCYDHVDIRPDATPGNWRAPDLHCPACARCTRRCVNFCGLGTRMPTAVLDVCLFRARRPGAEHRRVALQPAWCNGVWSAFVQAGCGAGQRSTACAPSGPWQPEAGLRFNPAQTPARPLGQSAVLVPPATGVCAWPCKPATPAPTRCTPRKPGTEHQPDPHRQRGPPAALCGGGRTQAELAAGRAIAPTPRPPATAW
jgi:hypothetical protein